MSDRGVHLGFLIPSLDAFQALGRAGSAAVTSSPPRRCAVPRVSGAGEDCFFLRFFIVIYHSDSESIMRKSIQSSANLARFRVKDRIVGNHLG